MSRYKFDWAAALVPLYGHYRAIRNFSNNLKTNGFSWKDLNGGFWVEQPEESDSPINSTQDILGYVGDARSEYLADRAHTEMREDTAYQRAVVDMRSAGLNPYTVTPGGAASSSSSVGENYIMSRLQAVGYILDLQNLSLQNKRLANSVLGNILGYLGTRK